MSTPPSKADRIGIVVIGRNEGKRLVACLDALQESGRFIVYVDSGSADGSVQAARTRSDVVGQLDPERPFSAARARNEGFAILARSRPSVEYVQFVDGDCTLSQTWLERAERAMDADARLAIVVGVLEERYPDASIFNTLCALEWRSPTGDLRNFGALGGIMLVRAPVFSALGGFDESVIAGEDSEFGVRAFRAGFKTTKIDALMAIHDAEIHGFRQWWKRAIRSGHAIGQRFSLHGRGPLRDCARERRSAVFWGAALPSLAVAALPVTGGLSVLLLSAYGYLGYRIARYRRCLGDNASEARLYAVFVVLSKFAEVVGLAKFTLNRLRGRYRIIEYK